jgi:hypothetical protein
MPWHVLGEGGGIVHDSGIERAYLYIAIANTKLWLNHYGIDDDVVSGFDGASEQCDNCGHDIEEHGEVKKIRKDLVMIVCKHCKTGYIVHNANEEGRGV